eukprot:scaffold1170_cov122-Cylindrotheca_fusiformis.AAC.30
MSQTLKPISNLVYGVHFRSFRVDIVMDKMVTLPTMLKIAEGMGRMASNFSWLSARPSSCDVVIEAVELSVLFPISCCMPMSSSVVFAIPIIIVLVSTRQQQ